VSAGWRVPLLAAIASIALVGAYAALGGTDYSPTPVADPCAPRTPPTTGTETAEVVQRVVLIGVDRAACSLGTSREELVLALRSPDDLEALARREGRDRSELEQSVRDGLVGAVDAAVSEGVLSDRIAGVVRFAARSLPLGLLLTLLRGLDQVVGA
jgi:hypothetical protein